MNDWKLYDPDASPLTQRGALPKAPPWRQAGARRDSVLAATFRPDRALVDAVNTALYLRRPLLLTGKPGTGKSSLAYSVAGQMALGKVIEWAVNSRSTLQEGLYNYDALARLQHIQYLQARAGGINETREGHKSFLNEGFDKEDDDLGMFLTLGPLGSALASKDAPRVLLVDEIDKSDVDLPNDLLNILDTGHFIIPELKRATKYRRHVEVTACDGEIVDVVAGEITFTEYPFVVMTSNGERDFPSPFLRRCVQCQIPEPDEEELTRIVAAHFIDNPRSADVPLLIKEFVKHRSSLAAATDQLLNAVHLLADPTNVTPAEERVRLLKTLFQNLA